MDVNFFKPFIEGTVHTLKVQCETESTSGKPFIKGQGPTIDTEIIAVIGLNCTAFTGTIALYFTKEIYLELMSKMLSEPFHEITNDLQDGAAELLNMIFGHAKKILNTQGYDIQKALPTIIRGKNLEASHLTNDPIIVIPFKTKGGEFQIEICAGPNLN